MPYRRNSVKGIDLDLLFTHYYLEDNCDLIHKTAVDFIHSYKTTGYIEERSRSNFSDDARVKPGDYQLFFKKADFLEFIKRLFNFGSSGKTD